jgi:hypothetical protein
VVVVDYHIWVALPPGNKLARTEPLRTSSKGLGFAPLAAEAKA